MDQDRRYYEYVITYDIECFLPRTNLPTATPSTEYEARHEFLSVSVCSNVPGYTSPVCFVRETDADECVGRFVAYLREVAEKAGRLTRQKFDDVFNTLRGTLRRRERREASFADSGMSKTGNYRARKALSGLMPELNAYVNRVPVVGFNSQNYDLNVMKSVLFRHLQALDEEDEGEILSEDEEEGKSCKGFVVKKVNKLTCIETRRFRFLDICNFIAPGYSYDKYLKAYKCTQTKGFFPYEWMDSLDKLNHKRLPSREAFYSRLKGCGIAEEDYAYCQKVWRDRGMRTVRDFLVWYNDLDVEPFVQAIERQRMVYRAKGIDMLKEAISLPGLAIRWMFKEAPQPDFPRREETQSVGQLTRAMRSSMPVCLIDEDNRDLYRLIKNNLVGGPSVIFHRYHEKDKTSIRQRLYGEEARPCASILGVDANALYLWCMMQDMPTGRPQRTRGDDVTESLRGCSKVSLGWLAYTAWNEDVTIKHALNGGEVRLGQHGLPVDGFDVANQTVYEFYGCYWHGHECPGASLPNKSPPRRDG